MPQELTFHQAEILRVMRSKATAQHAAIVFASLSELAKAAHCSTITVRRTLRFLLTHKIIEQVHTGDSRSPSGYRVIPQKGKGGTCE